MVAASPYIISPSFCTTCKFVSWWIFWHYMYLYVITCNAKWLHLHVFTCNYMKLHVNTCNIQFFQKNDARSSAARTNDLEPFLLNKENFSTYETTCGVLRGSFSFYLKSIFTLFSILHVFTCNCM